MDSQNAQFQDDLVHGGQVQSGKLDKVSFIIFLITAILTPIVFIPTSYAPLDMTKTLIITLGVLISGILYFISAYKQRNLYLPKNSIITTSLLLVVSILISSILSTNFWKSFFGQGFEIGTASFLLILFLGSLLTIYFTNKDREKVFYVYGAIIIPFIILAIFHIIRLFAGPEFMSFGILQSTTSTFIGKWNDLAIYSAVIALLSYIGLQFISLSRLFKALLLALVIVSGFFVFIINSFVVWSCVAIVMAALVVYQYIIANKAGTGITAMMKRLPILSLVILVIAVACAWKGNDIAAPIIKKLNIEQTEVSLPWQLTIDIAADSTKEAPLFGAGSNRFGVQYLKYKPQIMNPSMFWNTEFAYGFGFIPTFVVTQGIVGTILWALFLILFVYNGIKALKKTNDTLSRFFTGSTFFVSVFLWLISIVYVPSHSILLLAFIFSGLFISTSVSQGYIPMVKVCKGNRFERFAPVLIIVVIVVSAAWLIVYAKKTTALAYFQGGINSLNLPQNQGIDKAEANFKKALSLDRNDIYYQALSEADIVRINMISQEIQAQAQQGAKTADPELVKKIGALVEEAIGYTRNATAIDPTNYYNYVAEARISEVAMSLKVQNAYENAKTAYMNALAFNPYNPALYLNLARIEASQNKLADAQKYIGAALQLKQNYTEAIFLLSQIQVSQGQIKDAITSVQVAAQINPNNPLVFFQLGFLYYSDKNYQGAIDALSKAVVLNNQYANARYFLGLAYARLGKIPDAIIQFENIAETNPESQEVSLILSNLKAGKSPFTDAKPPIDSTPEKRKTLPVKEKTTETTKPSTKKI